MLHSRLLVARYLLSPDGVIFISIDDGEIHNLLRLLDEVFGHENRIGIISWRNVTDNNPNVLYEVGIAHTLGRPVVPIAQAPASRPFDIAHHRILGYVPDAKGLTAMRDKLARRLRHLAT